jgi:hypothetical protein
MMAVTLSLIPRRERRRADSRQLSPRVLVMGILALHLGEVIRQHLEAHRLAGDGRENVPGEIAVIGNARLAHQRRIGGQAADIGPGMQIQHARPVGAVGENPHAQIGQRNHGRGTVRERIIAAASGSDRTLKW